MGLSNLLDHGTYEMFRDHKCRCSDCWAAREQHRKEVKAAYRKRISIEHPERRREAVRKHRMKNPDANRAKAREWNIKNRERYNENMRRWRQANKDKVAATNRETKVLRRNVERKKFTLKDWRSLQARFGFCCAYCGTKTKLTVDHVVPLSRGGRHSIGNILPACNPCNNNKRAKFLVEWRSHRGA